MLVMCVMWPRFIFKWRCKSENVRICVLVWHLWLFLFLFLYNICVCVPCPRLTVSNGDVDQIMRRFAYLYNPNCSLPSSLNHRLCSCRTSNRFVWSILIYMVSFICIFTLPLTSSTSLSSQLQLCLFEWASYICRAMFAFTFVFVEVCTVQL